MNNRLIVLQEPHPYLESGSPVQLPVRVWSKKSTKQMTRAELERKKFSPFSRWISIAGPYNLRSAEDTRHLMSLLWDMEGMPMFPFKAPRRKATYRMVEEAANTVVVYLAASEYDNAFSEQDRMESDPGSLMAG